MKRSDKIVWTHTIVRILIGLMFVFAGYSKFRNPGGTSGMLTGIGFPVPEVFAWILLLSEIIFGLCLVSGYKVKYTGWPLVIILLIAWLTVTIPNIGILSTNSFFHLVSAAILIMIAFNGPGKLALSKK